MRSCRSGRVSSRPVFWSRYNDFDIILDHLDRFELDLRGHTQVRGAAFPCLRLKLADIVLI